MIKKHIYILLIGLVNVGSLFADRFLQIDDDGRFIQDYDIPSRKDSEYKEVVITIGPSLGLNISSGLDVSNVGLANFNIFSIKESGFTKRFNASLLGPLDLNLGCYPIVNGYNNQLAWGWGYSFIHNKRNILTLTGGLGFDWGMDYGLNDHDENNFWLNCEDSFYPVVIDLSYEIFFGKSSKDGISIGVTGYWGWTATLGTSIDGGQVVRITPRISYAHRFGD